MVKKPEMPHLWTMDTFSAEKFYKGHGEGDICTTPVRTGMGRSEEEEKFLTGRNCEQSC